MKPFAALRGLMRRPLASYYLLMAAAALLLTIGLVMVLSASSIDSYVDSGSAFTVFLKQVQWAAIGLVAFWLALVIRPQWYRWLGYPLLLLATGMLSLLLLRPELGAGQHGRWLDLGIVQVQPSELAKLALALWGADVLVRKQKLIGEWRQLAIPLIPVSGIVLLLVGANDLGTMLCLLLVVLALMWVSGVRFRVLAGLGGVALVAIGMLISSRAYRIERLTSFINPFADQDVSGYQSVQGLYALSTGGWWGVGLGQSRSKWERLPEAHNDFIFAIVGEELGIIGCLVVIVLYCVFAYAGTRIARRINDPYIRLVSAACVVWLSGQAFINMAQVVGLLPVTGIPLPLISAGGSSLVLTMFVVGMLAAFARMEPEAVQALQSRRRTRWSRASLIWIPPVPTSDKEDERTESAEKPVPASVATKRSREPVGGET